MIPKAETINVNVVIKIIEDAMAKNKIPRHIGEEIIQDIYHRTDEGRFKKVNNHMNSL